MSAAPVQGAGGACWDGAADEAQENNGACPSAVNRCVRSVEDKAAHINPTTFGYAEAMSKLPEGECRNGFWEESERKIQYFFTTRLQWAMRESVFDREELNNLASMKGAKSINDVDKDKILNILRRVLGDGLSTVDNLIMAERPDKKTGDFRVTVSFTVGAETRSVEIAVWPLANLAIKKLEELDSQKPPAE